MTMLQNPHSKTYYKFIAAFLTLTVILTTCLTAIMQYFFSAKYTQKLENIYSNSLIYSSDIIYREVTEEVQRTFTQIVNNPLADVSFKYFIDKDLDGNHAKLKKFYDNVVSLQLIHSELVEAIHVYYLEKDLLVSSRLGIKINNLYNKKLFTNIDWMTIASGDENIQLPLWTTARPIYSNVVHSQGDSLQLITYFNTYPTNVQNGRQAECIIAIDMKEKALSRVIYNTLPEWQSETYIINQAGTIISAEDKSKLRTSLFATQEEFHEAISDTSHRYILQEVQRNNTKSLLSAIPLQDTPFLLVNIVHPSLLYSESKKIQLLIILLGSAFFIFGLYYSLTLSHRLYKPLENLAKSLKSMSNIEASESEYELINQVVANLNGRITELNHCLIDNQPLMKHTFVLDLLHHIIIDRDVIEKRLDLLNHNFEFDSYTCITLNLDSKDLWQKLDLNQQQVIRYSIIDHIENLSNENHCFMCAEISDSVIGVLLGFNKGISTQNIYEKIIQVTRLDIPLPLILSCGSMVKDLLKLHSSYKCASIVASYAYFYPNKKIFTWDEYMQREMSKERLDDQYMIQFNALLNSRDQNGLPEFLDKIIDKMLNENYTIDYCNRILLDLLRILSKYMKTTQTPTCHNAFSDLYEDFSHLTDIYAFREWLLAYTQKHFELLDSKKKSKNSDLINYMRTYMEKHYAEDISLDSLAEHANITPRYLSKLFKEEIGINFSNLLIEIRMDKARTLLLDTTKTVEQISNEVGYRTTSYFIRIFKKTYGYTPNRYRQLN